MNRKFIVAGIYIGLFAYYYSFIDYGFNIWDEGGYAYGTLRTYNGQTALKDFNPNGYLPGRYLYGSLFFHLFGVNVQSLRIGVFLLTPAMVLMVFAVGRKFMPTGFSFLAAVALASAPAMYYNRFYTIFCVIVMYCVAEFISRKKGFYLFVLAGAIVTAWFFKVEVAIFGFTIGMAIIGIMYLQGTWNRSRNENVQPLYQGNLRIPMVLSSLVLAALGIYIVRNDLVSKIWDIIFNTHKVWGNPFPVIWPYSKVLREIGVHDMFERLLFYLPLLVYLGTFLILASTVIKNKLRLADKDLQVLNVLSFGICAFGLVIWRAGFDNLLRVLPPFYILFCYILYVFWREVHNTVWFKNLGVLPDAGKKTILNVVIVALPFLFYYEMNTAHGFYAGSRGAIKKERGFLQMNRLNVYTHPKEAAWLKNIVHEIELYSKKGEPILALPLNPVFYYLTDRVNPTPYDWILPGMLDETAQGKVVDMLRANPPKIILYVDIPIDSKEERRFSNYAPVIFKYIVGNYVRNDWIGFFQILLPKVKEEDIKRLDEMGF